MNRATALDLCFGVVVLVVLSIAAVPALAQDFKAILSDPHRPQGERDLDAIRKPEQVLKSTV